MQIAEAAKTAGLTKKAVEYYIEQGLVSPAVLKNGYREFSPKDAARLKRIALYRKLGLSAREIRAVLEDDTRNALQTISIQKELELQRETERQKALEKLSAGASEAEIAPLLCAADRKASVAQKLLEAFPGYYGRFVCLHFARFLEEPILTAEQQAAYEEILAFLDGVPFLEFPEDLKAFLDETTAHLTPQRIREIDAASQKNMEHFDRFLEENRSFLEEYLAWKNSEEYRASPAFRLQEFLNGLNQTSGYYDRFLPAMKRLSPSYDAYCLKLEAANETFLKQYPELQPHGPAKKQEK